MSRAVFPPESGFFSKRRLPHAIDAHRPAQRLRQNDGHAFADGGASARGRSVAPFKSGPDYLDAAQHRAACGHVSHNLDEFLMNGRDIRTLLAMGEASCDVALIEGAMG